MNEHARPDTFDDLHLERAIRLGLDTLELTELTDVQAESIPPALDGRDILLSSETGSGKTLAYLIPVAQRILAQRKPPSQGTVALILVPTRELARQVLKEARQLLQKSSVQVQAMTGGADSRYQTALLRKDPEILVATPGRILELSKRGVTDFKSLQILVLDEADRMLDLGFRDDVLALTDFMSAERQSLLVSATLNHRGVQSIANRILREPIRIEVDSARRAHKAIRHEVVLADSQEHKDQLLCALLTEQTYRRALIFSNKRSTADRLTPVLREAGLRVETLHGEMSTEARKAVMVRYRQGGIDILSASDVAARGLDVAGVDLVVNYDFPRSGDDYVHRTGRTGRAGETGVAVSFVGARDWNLMISIQRYLQVAFSRRVLSGLKARYNGPKKQKTSGKAVGSKRKKTDAQSKKSAKQQRKRPAKASAAKRSSSEKRAPEESQNDGFAPLTRRKQED